MSKKKFQNRAPAKEKNDTICAISTPLGEGGIGVIRISGQEAFLVTEKVFRGSSKRPLHQTPSHTLLLGHIIDPDTGIPLDEVLLGIMRGPRTHTREDVVEISGHGGPVLLHRILNVLFKNGARLAEPGEFTKRAFLNGRIDLTQAEAVMELIKAKTEEGCHAAMKRLEGDLSREILALRERLATLLALTEAAIDFPEDDLEIFSRKVAINEVEDLLERVEGLISTSEDGRILQEGLATVIVGRPNVGKSSLLNQLLKQNRAIVTPFPGTTRDTLEEYINIKGVPVRLVDTAGLRPTVDPVEKEGVRRTEVAMAGADLVLVVVDASCGLVKEEEELLNQNHTKRKQILVINKVDLAPSNGRRIKEKMEGILSPILTSATKGEGLDELKEAIMKAAFSGARIQGDGVLVARARHKQALQEASEGLKQALNSIRRGMPEDLIAVDVRASLDRLGDIVGITTSEEILDRIFSTFCIGK